MHVFIDPESSTRDSDRLTEFESLVAAGTTALNAIPGAVWVCDHEGRLVSHNRLATQLWGQPPATGDSLQQLFGSHLHYTASGQLVSHDSNPVAVALSRGIATENEEIVIERPDGSRLTTLFNVRPLFDFEGSIQGAVNCFHDISDAAAHRRELVRRSEQLEDFFDHSVVAMHIVDESGIVTRANDAELKLLGYREEEYIGRPITDFHTDSAIIADILARLARGEKLQDYPASLRAKDGSIRHVKISSSGRFHHGKFLSSRCCTIDLTLQRQLEEKVRVSERHLRDLLEALPAAVYTTDVRGRVNYYNEAAAQLAGRQPTLGVDEWCVSWKLYHADGRPLPHDQCPMAICLREARPVRDQQAILERPDGTRVPFAPYPTPLWDGEGNLVGAINMLVDITAHKISDDRQNILIAELNHRVKNSLATVQSLTRRTARHAKDVHDFAATLEARVIALARAHDLLSRKFWDGISFETLLREIVTPLADTDERLTMEGDAVHTSPRAALSLTMALNELATNAAKYGAFHGHHGTVEIRWKVHTSETQIFELDWVERGGPVVARQPQRGFGSYLMTRCIERDLNGQCDLRFNTSGVHCRFIIPLSELNQND